MTKEHKIEEELVLLVGNAVARHPGTDRWVSLRYFSTYLDDDTGLSRRVLLRAGFLPDIENEDRWTSGPRIAKPLYEVLNYDALVDVLDRYDPVGGFEDA